MKWEKYQYRFSKTAKLNGCSETFVNSNLSYAKKLYDEKLPIIFDTQHFSKLVGYNVNYIVRAIKNTPNFYRYFKIQKKNGDKREISEPLPSLKEIQYWILHHILSKRPVSKFAKAYIKNRSIRSNAFFHQNKKVILTIDIENFFGSINKSTINDVFLTMGYNNEVSNLLSSLCCLHGTLPQGAPTSPYLSNIVFYQIDQTLSSFCVRKGISYTRYSDDLTFSGDFFVGGLIKYVDSILTSTCFIINRDKVRTRSRNQSQEVTGIIVNEKLQAPKRTRRQFRQAVYYIKKYGLSSHLEHINCNRNNYLNHLIGIGQFILFVNDNDKNTRHDLVILKELKKKFL